jgi:hypothetical protein
MKQYTEAQQQQQKKAGRELLGRLMFLMSKKIKQVNPTSRMGRRSIRLNALVIKTRRGAMWLSLNMLAVGLLSLGGCTPY